MRIVDLIAELFNPSVRHVVEEQDSRDTLRQTVESGAGTLGVDLDAGVVVIAPAAGVTREGPAAAG